MKTIHVITIGHLKVNSFTQLFFNDKAEAIKELERFYNNYRNTCVDINATESPKYNDYDCNLEQFYTENDRYYCLTESEVI